MKLSVVVPAYNERGTIEEILGRIQAATIPGLTREILVVDDGSSDGTREILENLAKRQAAGETQVPRPGGGHLSLEGIHFLYHTRNQGKGAAVRTGFGQATGDIVLVQDADLEYDPRDYPKLLEPILDGRADVVYGTRFLGGPQRVHYFWHYVGNAMITLLSDCLTNMKLTDLETGYKVFRREVLSGLRIRSNRFGFEPEITAKIAKREWRVYEVPISYAGRTYKEGKKITWRDGLKAILCIIRYRFMD